MTVQLERSPHRSSIPAPSHSSTGLKLTGLAILLCGGFLPLLDFFIVNVALPTMTTTLHASGPMLQLVVAGYGIAYALMLVVGGRLGDAIGRRRMFMIGVAGFTLSSLLCGLAPSIGALIALRILQGLSAAMSQPQVLATIHATLDGPRRARAIALYVSMGGVGATAGQLFGGALVQANLWGLSWRPIFLVNVPVGLAVLALARRFVPATKSVEPAGVDLVGTALLGVTLVALLVPLTEGRALGWPAWTWVLLALAPIAGAAAIAVERRIERRGGAPLIAPSLVSLPSMRRGLALAIPFFGAFGAFMFVFALAVQDGLHYSPVRSGLSLAPMMVTFLIGTLVAPRLVARFGGRAIAVALGTEVVALVVLAIQVLIQWPHIGTFAMAPEFLVAGFAQAIAMVTLLRTVLADVPQRLSGIGSGILVTVQNASLALGVASLGSVYLSVADLSPAGGFGLVLVAMAVLFGAVAVGSLWLLSGTGSTSAAKQPEVAIEL
ncbi:MAG TPA: MFS transporter [Streptosporangiaceae bacterium]|nr:MFS transporter [Streptosporangiaceae bacterium]